MNEFQALASVLYFAIFNVMVPRGGPHVTVDNGAFLSLVLPVAILFSA